jgi:hypothetical protein
MKAQSAIRVFSLLALLVASCGFKNHSNGRLMVTQTSTKTPFGIRITGPDRLIEQGEKKWGKWVGCGYWVEWGDGARSRWPEGLPKDCTEGFTHSYENPGKYTVRAVIFHPGPADETVVDWTGTVEFEIEEK